MRIGHVGSGRVTLVGMSKRPVGRITRGTTGVNRLRRLDRWLLRRSGRLLRGSVEPVVVDVGFGATAHTAWELARRVRGVAPGARVLAVDIDPLRVERARCDVRQWCVAEPDVRLGVGVGGFELGGIVADYRPVVVRAANVLRQYEEGEVPALWRLVTDRLAPGGLFVDATCDEIGRVCSWAALTADGPESLTCAVNLAHLPDPSILAQRLPKALIHRNVPGERVHSFLAAFQQEWVRQAPLAAYGNRQRWVAACQGLARSWPVLGNPRHWRDGELTVAWDAVAPSSPSAA